MSGGGELLEGLQQQIQKIQKGVARTLNSFILDTFYISEMKFYKNNINFQRKRGGRGLVRPPLNLPTDYSNQNYYD